MHLNGSNGISQNDSFSALLNEQNAQEIDLFKIFNLLLLHKFTIIGFVFFFTTLALVVSLSLKPVYESNGTIFISESKNRYSYAGSDLANLLTTTYGIGVGSTIANEIQLLSSKKLSKEVASRLLNVEYDSNGERFPILWKNYPDNPDLVGLDTVAIRIRDKIKFEQVNPEADLINISIESYSPEEAAQIVNTTISSYSNLSTAQNRSMAISALSFLEEQKEKIRRNLMLNEDSLQIFMDYSNLVTVDAQTSNLITEISKIASEIQSTNVLLFTTESGISEFSSQLENLKPGLPAQIANSLEPTIQRYQYELAELFTERLLLLTRNKNLNDNSPQVKDIQRQIDLIKDEINLTTKQLINSDSDIYLTFISDRDGGVTTYISELSKKITALKVERAQFQTQKNILEDYYSSLNSQFEELPENIIELGRLRRDLKINEELFLLVSNQYAEMSLWEKTQFGLGRPLDLAEIPARPIKPRKKIITIIGFLLGGLLGVGFVIIKDMTNDRIISTDNLKESKLPLLGTIPDFSILNGLDSTGRQYIDNKSVSNQLITFLDHISPISEAYRRLRINVVYANPDKQYKVIMVTSAGKGEGKSTVAANLAVTFSEAEKNVLLIDLDLRRPTQHKIFGENREPGLTESLFETFKMSDVIRSSIAPNVDILTVGKKTPEPATVLDSKRLKQLIDKLKDKYDHIILDTAPYGIISDSASLLRLVDGLVVVSRFNVTTKRELAFTLDGLQHLNADILGLVLNAFNPEKSTDYYTSYSYYKRTYYTDYYKEDEA